MSDTLEATNIDVIRESARSRLSGRKSPPNDWFERERDVRLATCAQIAERQRAEGRALLASEQRQYVKAVAQIDEITELLEDLTAPERALDAYARRFEHDAEMIEHTIGGAGSWRVTSQPMTYGGDARGPNFVMDLYASQRGDFDAVERLQRHRREVGQPETRDVGTSAVGGLVPPAYLTDRFVELARAGRPYLARVTNLPLTQTGMTVNISRLTTGTAVASQATENTAVQETDADDTLLSIPVVTVAGQQDVSRQAIERGEFVETMLLADLAAAYNAELDRQALVGDGTSGTHLGVAATTGIVTVTYTDASPTVVELFPKIADAIQQIASNVFLGADVIYMHPRRWGWICAALDTTNRPLVAPMGAGPFNAFGVAGTPGYGEPVGTLLGLPVITDANIPTNLGAGTNEDEIIVAASRESVLWEQSGSVPFTLRLDDVLGGNLTVKLVAYGYSAFTAGRKPKATAKITGTGFVTPTF